MGLPVNHQTHQATEPEETSDTSASNPTNPLSSTEGLPNAALELASKLFDLARSGDTATLAQYLSAGLRPNLTNHEGNTLLMLAAYNGHPEMIRLLLDKGADVNVLNDRGQSPIAGAMFKGHDAVIEALWKADADLEKGQPNAKDCAVMFRRERWIREFGIEPTS